VVIFRIQKGSASKIVWETLLEYSLRETAVFYRKLALSRTFDEAYNNCALHGQGF